MKSIQIGKYSWGHLRLGSYISAIAILVALGVSRLAEWLGTPDDWWVEVVEWLALAIFAGDILRSLARLSPRKRWERVMLFSLIFGGVLLLCAVWLYWKGQPLGNGMTWIALAILLIGGVGGWWMWRRSLQALSSRILDRKLKRKSRKL